MKIRQLIYVLFAIILSLNTLAATTYINSSVGNNISIGNSLFLDQSSNYALFLNNFGVTKTTGNAYAWIETYSPGDFATLELWPGAGGNSLIASETADSDLYFRTNGLYILRLESDGKVGIGDQSTDVPYTNATLHINSSFENSFILENSTGTKIIYANRGGRVGIRTETPTSELHVNGVTNTTYLTIASATAASCDLKAHQNGTVYCGTDSTGAGSSDGTGGWLNTSAYTTTTYNVNITGNTLVTNLNVTRAIQTPSNISIGSGAMSNASGSIAIGHGAKANAGDGTVIVIGQDATTSTDARNSLIIGKEATTTGIYATSIGYQTNTGQYAIALGSGATATSFATALGADSDATNTPSIAIGYGAQATGYASLALGTETSATQAYAIAIGYGISNGNANTLQIGNRSQGYNGTIHGNFNSTGILSGRYLKIENATAGSCDLKADTNGNVYCGTDATGAAAGDGTGGWINTSTYTQYNGSLNITNSSGSSVFLVNTSNGYVTVGSRLGIVTTEPRATLAVAGQLTLLGQGGDTTTQSVNLLFGDYPDGNFEQIYWDHTTSRFTLTDEIGAGGGISIGQDYASGVNPPANGLAVQGSVSIGMATPTSTLQVNGTTNTTYLIIADATAASCDLKAYQNGTVYCGTDATGGGGGGSGNLTSMGSAGYIPFFNNNTQVNNSLINQSTSSIQINGNITMPVSFFIGRNGIANSSDSIAIGTQASAYTEYSIAIGRGATAQSQQYAIAFGGSALADGENALAVGSSASALGYSQAIGSGATSGLYGVALGDGADSTGGWDNIAIGDDTEAKGGDSIAVGQLANATGAYAISIGRESFAPFDSSIALGLRAIANYTTSIAIGTDAKAFSGESTSIVIGTNAISRSTGDGRNIVIGSYSNSTHSSGYNTMIGNYIYNSLSRYSVLIGDSAFSDNFNVVGVGYASNVSGFEAVGVGLQALARSRGTAIGAHSQAYGDETVAVGHNAQANTDSSIAIGKNSYTAVGGSGNIAIGYGANATIGYATSIGTDAVASGSGSISIGTLSLASHTNSIALGTVATTTSDNQLVVGGSTYGYNGTIFGNFNSTGILSGRFLRISNTTAASCDLKADTNGNVYCGTDATGAGSSDGTGGWLNTSAYTTTTYNVNITGNTLVTNLNVTRAIQTPSNISIGSGAMSNASGSIAIGHGAKAFSGESTSIVIGTNAISRSTGDGRNIVIGSYSNSTHSGGYNTMIGNYIYNSLSRYSVLIGDSAFSDNFNVVGVGYASNVSGFEAVGVGLQALARTRATAIGGQSSAYGDETVAVGHNAQANTDSSIAIGKNSYTAVGGSGNIAIGYGANSTGTQTISLGLNAKALTNDAIAIGVDSNASGLGSVVIGVNSKTAYLSGIAIGPDSSANEDGAMAIGAGATTTEGNSYASMVIGYGGTITGTYGVALGDGVVGSGHRIVVIGSSANASGPDAIAIGNSARVRPVDYGIAIGAGASTDHDNSIALGTGANTSTTHQLVVGNSSNYYNALYYGNFSPGMNNTYSLGTPDNTWRNVYVGNMLDANDLKKDGNEVLTAMAWSCSFFSVASPYCGLFTGTATGSGTGNTAAAGSANHPGVVQFRKSTTAASGYAVNLGVTSILLNGSEEFSMTFNPNCTWVNTNNSFLRMGYLDTTSNTEATDGVYWYFFGNLTQCYMNANIRSNSVWIQQSANYTMSNGWYKLYLRVLNATQVNFTLYDDNFNVLRNDLLNGSVPMTTGRETGCGFSAQSTAGTTAIKLIDVDYMKCSIERTLRPW